MWYPDLQGRALEEYRNMVAELKRRAMTRLGLPATEIVVRDLRPDDIGPNNAGSTQDNYYGITATTWDTVIDANEIADNRFVGICGFYFGGTTANPGPGSPLAQVRITKAGELVRYWHVQPIYNFRNKTGYTDEPIIVDQNTKITVENWGRTAGSVSNWGFIGAVVEKRGLLINP